MPGAQSSFAGYKGMPDEFRWECVLARLAAEGQISRTRLLDASLSGLEHDFPEARARWYAQVHEALAPTIDERAARVDRYLGLPGSRNPSTVTFALKALALLECEGRIEPHRLLSAVRPALQARARGPRERPLISLPSSPSATRHYKATPHPWPSRLWPTNPLTSMRRCSISSSAMAIRQIDHSRSSCRRAPPPFPRRSVRGWRHGSDPLERTMRRGHTRLISKICATGRRPRPCARRVGWHRRCNLEPE